MATKTTQKAITVNPIVKTYATLVKARRKTLDQVPETIRADVKAYVETVV